MAASSHQLISHIITQTDLASPQHINFLFGEAVFFTTRAPNKSSINEDALALIPYDSKTGVILIADGMGGLPEGQRASHLAVTTLDKQIQSAAAQQLPLRDAILDGIEFSHQAIVQQGRGSGTTLALVEVQPKRVRVYNVGDSIVLQVGQRGKHKLQSISHSPVGYAVESGLLDADEAMHHAERHLISNALGTEQMHIELGISSEMSMHDTLLVASDGLTDNLYPDEIREVIRKGSLMDAAQILRTLAMQRMTQPQIGAPSHPDDLSFILFRAL